MITQIYFLSVKATLRFKRLECLTVADSIILLLRLLAKPLMNYWANIAVLALSLWILIHLLSTQMECIDL
jgi:hypothetical protein